MVHNKSSIKWFTQAMPIYPSSAPLAKKNSSKKKKKAKNSDGFLWLCLPFLSFVYFRVGLGMRRENEGMKENRWEKKEINK